MHEEENQKHGQAPMGANDHGQETVASKPGNAGGGGQQPPISATPAADDGYEGKVPFDQAICGYHKIFPPPLECRRSSRQYPVGSRTTTNSSACTPPKNMLETAVLEDKTLKETYSVYRRSVRTCERDRPVCLFVAITRQTNIFLWPVSFQGRTAAPTRGTTLPSRPCARRSRNGYVSRQINRQVSTKLRKQSENFPSLSGQILVLPSCYDSASKIAVLIAVIIPTSERCEAKSNAPAAAILLGVARRLRISRAARGGTGADLHGSPRVLYWSDNSTLGR